MNLFTLIYIVLFSFNSLHASEGKITSFKDVEKHLPALKDNPKARYNTWIFLDIDEVTLVQAAKRYIDPAVLKDKNLPNLITKWNSEGARIFFLTARQYKNIDNTINQLKSLGIDMDLIGFNAEYKGKDDPLEKLEYYRKGILFTDNDSTIKGERLVEFLGQPLHNALSDKPETVIFIDDLHENVKIVSEALKKTQFSDKHFALHYPKDAVAEKSPPRQDRIYAPPLNDEDIKALFPTDLTDFTYAKEQLKGYSGGVYILSDKAGKKFTLKLASSSEQIKEEILVDTLYRAFGVPVPAFMVVWELPQALKDALGLKESEGPYRIAEFIERNQAATQDSIYAQIRKYFIFDAFLSNWDVAVRDGMDNSIMDKKNVLWRIDNGAGLRFRAMGERKKPSDTWDPYWVTEIKTLRSPKFQEAHKIYGLLEDAEIKAQAQQLIQKFPGVQETLREMGRVLEIDNLEDLDHRLVSRYRDLKIRYGDKVKMSPIGHKYEWAVPNKTSASTFIYKNIKGTPHVLLGKRVGTMLWGNLGGASDPGDKTLAAAAVRETYEESMGLLRPTEQEILAQPSHDLLTESDKFGFLRHRMYFYNLEDELDLDRLKLLLKNPGQSKVYHRGEVEYVDFKWVPISEIVTRLDSPDRIKKTPSRSSSTEETTIELDFDKEKMPIHPPFYRMLAQAPVHTQVKNLSNNQKLFIQNTQGWGGDKVQAPIDPKGFKITWNAENNSYKLGDVDTEFLHIESLEEKSLELAQTAVKRSSVVADIKKISPERVKQKFAKVGGIKYQKPHADIKAVQGEERKEYVFKEEGGDLEKILPQAEKVDRKKSTSQELKKATDSILTKEPHPELKDLKHTQTEAFLISVMGDKYDATKTIFENTKMLMQSEGNLQSMAQDEAFLKILEKLLESEKKHHKHFFTFFSATDSEIGFLAEFITIMREIVESDSFGDFKRLRGLDKPFEFTHVLDFQKYFENLDASHIQKTKQNIDYKPGYQAQAISVSAFLLGGFDTPTESAVHYLNKRQSILPPPLEKILEELFLQFGISVDIQKYIDLYEETYEPESKGEKDKKKNTAMFEIHINPDVMDEITLIANLKGKKVEFIPGMGHQPKKPLIEFMKNPKIKLNDVDSEHLKILKKAQFRVFLVPKIIQNTDNVRITQRWRYPPDELKLANYNKKLKQYVIEDLTKALAAKVQKPEGTYRIAGTSKGGSMSPTERVYAKAHKDILNQPIKYRQIETEPLSVQVRKLGTPASEVVARSLNGHKEDLNKPADYYNSEIVEKNDIKLLNFLLNKGLDINKTNTMYKILRNKNLEMLKFLLNRGAYIDYRNYEGKTLHSIVDDMDDPNLNQELKKELITDLRERHEDFIREVKKLLETDQDLPEGMPLIHWAVEKNNLKAVEYLLLKGAEIDTKDTKGRTPLMIANMSDDKTDIFRFLIEKGAGIEYKDKDGNTPLFKAILDQNVVHAKILIENKAGLSTSTSIYIDDVWTTTTNKTALTIAAEVGSLELAALSIQHGADVNEARRGGATPLTLAAASGHLKIVGLLIEHEANLEPEPNTDSALSKAISNGHPDVALLLLEKGADPKKIDRKGNSPLSLAIFKGQGDVVRVLAEKGLDLKKPDRLRGSQYPYREAKSPILQAIDANQIGVIQVLAESGAEVNINVIKKPTHYGGTTTETPLALWLYQNKHVDLAKEIVDLGADVNAKDSSGTSIVQVVAASEDVDFFNHLVLDKNAEINPKTEESHRWKTITPLAIAARKGQSENVKLLLDKGVDVNKESPLDKAAQGGHKAIVEALLEKGADIQQLKELGTLADILAAKEVKDEHIEIIKLLVERGADPNVQSKGSTLEPKKSLLRLAFEKKKLDLFKFLLSKEADINAPPYKYDNPLLIQIYEDGRNKPEELDLFNHILDTVENVNVNVRTTTHKYPLITLVAENGDIEVLKKLLDKDANPNAQSKWSIIAGGNDQITPLSVSAGAGHLESVRLLIEKGAFVNPVEENITLPLHTASLGGHVKVVKYLVEIAQADVTRLNKTETLIRVLAKKYSNSQTTEKSEKYNEILEFLIEKGADVNVMEDRRGVDFAFREVRDYGDTLLHMAYENKDKALLDKLLSHQNIDVNVKNKYGATLLHLYYKAEDFKKVKLLVTKRANPNIGGSYDYPPVFGTAARDGNLELVQHFVDKGADINGGTDSERHSPLARAAENGHKEIVEFLLTKEASLASENDYNNPLKQASRNGHFEIVKLLLDNKADIKDLDGDTFRKLYINGNKEGIKDLLERGADINMDPKYESVLYVAFNANDKEFFRFLLENKADPNKMIYGDILLHLAYKNGKENFVKLLLEYYPHSTLDEYKGNNLLKLAYDKKDWEMVKSFLGKGIGINAHIVVGVTLLNVFAIEGKLEMIKILIDQGVDVNLKGKDGWTALHFASDAGQIDIVKYLVDEAGADVHMTDREGKTARDYLSPEDDSQSSEEIDSQSSEEVDEVDQEIYEYLSAKMQESAAPAGPTAVPSPESVNPAPQ